MFGRMNNCAAVIIWRPFEQKDSMMADLYVLHFRRVSPFYTQEMRPFGSANSTPICDCTMLLSLNTLARSRSTLAWLLSKSLRANDVNRGGGVAQSSDTQYLTFHSTLHRSESSDYNCVT
jgi:hypothetical protein